MELEDWSTDYELLVKLLHAGIEVVCKAKWFDRDENTLIEDFAKGHLYDGYYQVSSHSCIFAVNLVPANFIEHCKETEVKFQIPWVPVEVALPSKDGLYLGFLQEQDWAICHNFVAFKNGCFCVEKWNTDVAAYQTVKLNVTHWRPLHSDPKAK